MAERDAASERSHLSRPFNPALLKRAKALAQQYRLAIEADPDVGYIGWTLELPLVMGGGRTIQACVRSVLEATAAAIATTLEHGGTPPAAAREGKRDQQLNIRLTAEEKGALEHAAQREGYRSVSDFIRAAALNRTS